MNFGTITGAGVFAGARTILAGSGNTVTNWGVISTDDVEPAMDGLGRDALVQNFGTIEAVAGGIGMRALGDVGPQARNTGTIFTQGDFGDGLNVQAGADGEAVNSGSIRTEGDGAAGVFIVSSIAGQVTNSGSIETVGGVLGIFAAAGVDAAGLDVLVHNTRTGSIETHDPSSPAVSLNIRDVEPASFRPGFLAADTQARLENEGLIRADQTAVLGGAGDETVINRGGSSATLSLTAATTPMLPREVASFAVPSSAAVATIRSCSTTAQDEPKWATSRLVPVAPIPSTSRRSGSTPSPTSSQPPARSGPT